MSLDGKVAIVTGAGRGIGAASAQLLAARGAQVIVNYLRNAQAVEQVVHEIEAAGGTAHAIQADVLVDADVARLVAETRERYGRIDILVCNANVHWVQKPFLELTWDDFAGHVDAELKASYIITQAVLPTMIEQHYGRLIYISSGVAKRPPPMVGPGTVAHGAAKAALVAFTKYIAQEFGPHGITANTVAPGLVETDASASVVARFGQGAAAGVPLGRVAQPNDVAGAVAFFASDDSGFMTGTYAPVNGGAAMD